MCDLYLLGRSAPSRGVGVLVLVLSFVFQLLCQKYDQILHEGTGRRCSFTRFPFCSLLGDPSLFHFSRLLQLLMLWDLISGQ
jgi:hypothetical protein